MTLDLVEFWSPVHLQLVEQLVDRPDSGSRTRGPIDVLERDGGDMDESSNAMLSSISTLLWSVQPESEIN